MARTTTRRPRSGGTATSTGAGARRFSTPSRGPFSGAGGGPFRAAAESGAKGLRRRCCAPGGPARREKAVPSVPNCRLSVRVRVSAPQPCPQASTHWSCEHCGSFPGLGEDMMAVYGARQYLRLPVTRGCGRPAAGAHFGGSPSRPSGEPRQRGGLGGPCALRLAQLQRSKLSCTVFGRGQQGKRRKRGALAHLHARRSCAWVQRVSDDTSGAWSGWRRLPMSGNWLP